MEGRIISATCSKMTVIFQTMPSSCSSSQDPWTVDNFFGISHKTGTNDKEYKSTGRKDKSDWRKKKGSSSKSKSKGSSRDGKERKSSKSKKTKKEPAVPVEEEQPTPSSGQPAAISNHGSIDELGLTLDESEPTEEIILISLCGDVDAEHLTLELGAALLNHRGLAINMVILDSSPY